MNILITIAFVLSVLQWYACLRCDLHKVNKLGEATLLTLQNPHDILRTGEELSQMLKTIYPTNTAFGRGKKSGCRPYGTIRKTLEKLDPIHENFKDNSTMNSCINYEWRKLFVRLSGLLLIKSNNNTSNEIRREIYTMCTDRHKGITSFVGFYLRLLRESKVKRRLRECIKYDSIQLEHFIRNNILRMNQIWILVGVCEETTGRITEFEKDVFVRDVTRYLSYIQSTMVIREFVSDDYGLKTVVKKTAEIQKTLHNLHKTLKKHFGYFNWKAVYGEENSVITNSFSVQGGLYTFFIDKTNRSVTVQWSKQINWMNLLKCEVNCTQLHKCRYKVVLKNIRQLEDTYYKVSLKHYYPFNGHLNDTVGGMNVVYTANSTFTLSRNNVQNGAIDLSEGYIKLPTTKFLNSEFTVTMWIKFKVYKTRQPLIRFGSSHRNNSLVVLISVWQWKNSSDIIVYTDSIGFDRYHTIQYIKLHRWNHYAFVYSNSTLCIYIDSSFFTCSDHLKFTFDKTDENYIGREYWTFDRSLNATVDDFRIYDRALKEFEIRKDSGDGYNLRHSENVLSQSVLVHYWPFDSSLLDVVSGLNGSGNGSLSFTEDYEGNEESAVDLSRGSIQLPSSLYLNYDFTISAWVKLKEYRNGQVLFSCGGGSTDRIQIRLSEEPHNYFYLYFSPTFNYDVFPSYVPLELNKWRHLTFVVSQSMDSIRMYINGVLVINAFDNKFDFEASGTNNCFIGRSLNMKSNAITLVNGTIDELKIFNRLLTDDEVLENMKSRKTSIFGGSEQHNSYEDDEYDLDKYFH